MSDVRDDTEKTREKLLSTAFRVLEIEGPQGLRARRLAAEIGTSTMPIYTHFGGMAGLVDAMVQVGLTRFADHVRANAPPTDDPMADLLAGGVAYGGFALGNPQLYLLMFGLAGGPRVQSLPNAERTMKMAEGGEALSVLLNSVERVIDAGLLPPQSPRGAATQILSVTHGFLLLQIGGFVEEDLQEVMPALAVNLMAGLGADRKLTESSLSRAFGVGA